MKKIVTRKSSVKNTILLLLLCLSACGVRASNNEARQRNLDQRNLDRPDSMPLNQVIVLGAIHGQHKESELFGIAELEAILRAVKPDFILAEIPPGDLPPALSQYRSSGEISEGRVSHFPEYVQAVIPLQAELGYEIVECAGWSAEMAKTRRTLLSQWKESRPDETRLVDEAMARADEEIESGHKADDPMWIHSPEYDAIVKRGMTPYDDLFGADLGAGGWAAINASHYSLIDEAIARHRQGGGKRFLVIFGAWHKYWFLEKLKERDDINLRSLRDFL